MILDSLASEKKYSIIYSDPPWGFSAWSDKAQRHVTKQYQTMTFDEINALPVAEIAAENAALFLWVTYPNLIQGIETMKHWGFQYKTKAFTWVKTNKNGSLFWGMGYYTRACDEVCLLGIRGKPLERKSHSVHSVVMSQIGKHSAKPPVVRDRIVELFGDLPRLEMFARETADGWDSWGNQVTEEPRLF